MAKVGWTLFDGREGVRRKQAPLTGWLASQFCFITKTGGGAGATKPSLKMMSTFMYLLMRCAIPS